MYWVTETLCNKPYHFDSYCELYTLHYQKFHHPHSQTNPARDLICLFMSASWKQGLCWSIFTGTHFPLGAWWGWHSLEGGCIDPRPVMRRRNGNPFGVAWGDITLPGGCSSLHTAGQSRMLGRDTVGCKWDAVVQPCQHMHGSTYTLSQTRPVVFRFGCSVFHPKYFKLLP